MCTKPHRGEPDNMWTLGVNAITGVFNCFRCAASGKWYKFKKEISGEQ
jgi:hypothetical protein